ncbi:hypothetical protein B0H15DRAFT_194815 [Mycena belliarum]|uniref:DUF6535 domain-containing protein n=1 Tax=Mycena belliarum TaxID=1033014 RepID=A0AAD6UK28_9AGAR|nr:hypothetical protein B0H15DRAFT_194815 [Mycena belliae]
MSEDHSKHVRDDDPSEKMWSVYMNQVDKHHRILVECWKADMNSILIFSGLFSASSTTFIIESYRTLTPTSSDPNQAALTIMLQLILAQSNGTNSTVMPPPLSLSNQQADGAPSASALVCNILFFLSLAFSLCCALSATLVDQWARNYILATESRPSLHKRARMSAYLSRGLRRFQMNTVVEAIPTLLHISLLLFFAGLVEFLRPINVVISYLMLSVLLLCGSLYLLVTFLPIFCSNCPYYTPISKPWWHILRAFGAVGQRESGGSTSLSSFNSMAEAREADATEISQERDERDLEAMLWTFSTLREDSELEPFLGFVPQLVSGFDYSAKLLLHKLLNHGDHAIGLRYRIPRLLGSCAEGRLNPTLSHSRSTTCLHAIWSLTMMAVPLSVPFKPSSRETVIFDEATLTQIRAVKAQIPSVADCADSTASVVSRSLLDMFVDMATAIEEDLAAFLRSGHWLHRRPPSTRDQQWTARFSPLASKKIWQQTHALEQLLSSAESATSPALYIVVDAVRKSIEDLVEVVNVISSGGSVEEGRILGCRALEHVRTLQRLLNETGLSLTLDYLSTLSRSPSLPYEAFNTLRRLFLKINFDSKSPLPFPTYAQAQIAAILDEALEQHPSRGNRLPASIINIILGISGSALDDLGCALKAQRSIKHYLTALPIPATRDEALKAISQLDSVLPDETRSTPSSDLLGSHLYANTKLERKRADDFQLTFPPPTVQASFKAVLT